MADSSLASDPEAPIIVPAAVAASQWLRGTVIDSVSAPGQPARAT